MTSDGIRTEDWTRVEELAAEIANVTSADDEEICAECVRDMMKILDELEAEYGSRPSILATRADYCPDVHESIDLLTRAYAIASTERDFQNMTLISSSIAERYIEELADVREGRFWIERLRECLEYMPDDSELETFRILCEELRTLERGQPASGTNRGCTYE